MKDDGVYLRYILECIRRIEEDIAGGQEQFMASHTISDAVLRNLQTMSETTQRLSAGLKNAHPETEWERIGAFRNVLVHDYLGVDLERVWDVITRNVPELKRQVLAILTELNNT